MRRAHLRVRNNIVRFLLIHGAVNLSPILRQLLRVGKVGQAADPLVVACSCFLASCTTHAAVRQWLHLAGSSLGWPTDCDPPSITRRVEPRVSWRTARDRAPNVTEVTDEEEFTTVSSAEPRVHAGPACRGAASGLRARADRLPGGLSGSHRCAWVRARYRGRTL